jgi:hypothetical protein
MLLDRLAPISKLTSEEAARNLNNKGAPFLVLFANSSRSFKQQNLYFVFRKVALIAQVEKIFYFYRKQTLSSVQ